MINFRTSAIAAAVLSSVVFAMPTSSQAMPQAAPVKIVKATNGNLVQVRRYYHRRHNYRRYRHYGHNYRRYRHYGHYRHRYNRRHYYANNYYYPNYYRSSYYCGGYYGGYYGNCGYPYYRRYGFGIPFITLGFGFGFGGHHHGYRHW